MSCVGFTGTRHGMSPKQRTQLIKVLEELYPTNAWFHHGDCLGADADAHKIAQELGYKIVIHPPIDPKYRAFCTNFTQIMLAAPYIERNHDIVDACDIIIATPQNDNEELRSGTWATIRYAVLKKRHIEVLKR